MTGMLFSPDENYDWQEEAVCKGVDPEMFFPDVGGRHILNAARQICEGCPVKAICLDFALKHDEWHGVWGGTGPDERRQMMGYVPMSQSLRGSSKGSLRAVPR